MPTASPLAAQDRDLLLYGRFVNETDKAAFIADRDGSGEHRILEQVVGDVRSVGWISGGNHLSFVVRDSKNPDGAIWTARADGEGAALYYDGRRDGCDSVFHPVWSPDGGRVAMVCYRREGSALAVLDVASRKLRLLATYPWPEFLDNPARWSSDGTILAYDILRWDPSDTFINGSHIATIPADVSAAPTYLNGFDSFAVRPAWGPHDGLLIYNTYDLSAMHSDEASDIFTMLPDGSNVDAFLTARQAGVARLAQPQWFGTPGRVWVTALTGAGLRIAWIDPETRQLTVLPIEGSEVELR